MQNGKYLLWHHNHGGWNFNFRNPAWISGGIEKDGKIIWGQPEILLYEDSINMRMSYPDLIEQDEKYWITETNKEEARCHEIPGNYFEKLWSSAKKEILSCEVLYTEWNEDDLIPNSTLENPYIKGNKFQRGFTINMKIQLGDLASNQLILSSIRGNDKLIELRTADYGSVKIILKDGLDITEWYSDPGLIKAYGEHDVAVIVDNESRTIQFVVDGKLCNGRDFRQYGWTHFDTNIDWIDFKRIQIGNLLTGQLRPKGRIANLRIYDSPLMNAEIISNHRQSVKDN
ncbi:MAG: LamG domain-containing protein [Chloroflexia bacterium]|nr:LamG domain-containing protein [Chloroflexia bacterium]